MKRPKRENGANSDAKESNSEAKESKGGDVNASSRSSSGVLDVAPPSLKDLVQSVLDVLPDSDPYYAKSLLLRFRCTDFHHVPAVLDAMATDGYDKRKGTDFRNEDEVRGMETRGKDRPGGGSMS